MTDTAVLEERINNVKSDVDKYYQFVREHMEREELDRKEIIELNRTTKAEMLTLIDANNDEIRKIQKRFNYQDGAIAAITVIVGVIWGIIKLQVKGS